MSGTSATLRLPHRRLALCSTDGKTGKSTIIDEHNPPAYVILGHVDKFLSFPPDETSVFVQRRTKHSVGTEPVPLIPNGWTAEHVVLLGNMSANSGDIITETFCDGGVLQLSRAHKTVEKLTTHITDLLSVGEDTSDIQGKRFRRATPGDADGGLSFVRTEHPGIVPAFDSLIQNQAGTGAAVSGLVSQEKDDATAASSSDIAKEY
jgi:hypothetical protein